MTDANLSVTTPASAGSSSTPAKLPALKDRTCPYCRVSFTSSSLGRHLDLYIKEKNPKPPDGIHNVDEIRKTRSNITRRQARSSVAKRQNQDTQRAGGEDHHSPDDASPGTGQDTRRNGAQYIRTLFNTPHWTSTGVITDSDANIQLLGEGRSPYEAGKEAPSGPQLDPATKRKFNEERERGRAAELALLEVLDSIKAAKKDRKPEVFTFDFFAHSFPSLCLKILSAPASMHMPTLIPDSNAWPIDPPDQATYEMLRRKVGAHVLQWRHTNFPVNPRKRPRSSGVDHPTPGGGGGSGDEEAYESPLEPVPLYIHHLNAAYHTWARYPETEKRHEWNLEVMRALAWEKEEHRKTQARIETLDTELARARLDNARLTECQMPREWLHTPASQLPIARLAAEKVERELTKEGLDAEKLITKWRPLVQAARNLSRKTDGAEERDPNRLVTIGQASKGGHHEGSGSVKRRRGSRSTTRIYDGRVVNGGTGAGPGPRTSRARGLGIRGVEDEDNIMGSYDDRASQGDEGRERDEGEYDDEEADEDDEEGDDDEDNEEDDNAYDVQEGNVRNTIEPSLRSQLAELTKRSAVAST